MLEVPPVRHFRRAQLVSIDEGAERLASSRTSCSGPFASCPRSDLRRNMMLEALNRVYLGIDFG